MNSIYFTVSYTIFQKDINSQNQSLNHYYCGLKIYVLFDVLGALAFGLCALKKLAAPKATWSKMTKFQACPKVLDK